MIIYTNKAAYECFDEKLIPAGAVGFNPEDAQMFIAFASGAVEPFAYEAVMVNSDNFASVLAEENYNLFICLESDIVIAEPITLVPGSVVNMDLNNFSISAADGISYAGGLITVPHGASLTVKGDGTFDSGAGVMSPFQMTSKALADDSKEAVLVINGGKFIGRDYIICGNGLAGRGNSHVVINGGEFEAGTTIIYNPQENSSVIINDGNFVGQKCGIEMRSGDLEINGGKFVGMDAPTEVSPNGNGTTTEGTAIAVCQHTTKNPINVVINDGEFEGYHAFYQANPQKNDEAAVALINLEINGGKFTAINDGTMPVYSENKEKFIKGGVFAPAVDEKYMA